MQQRQLRLGDILDDYCPRERRVTNHAVVAMVGDDVKQTRCTTCDADHEYKHAKVPRQRRKADSPAALYVQVVASGPKRVAHESPSTGADDAAADSLQEPDETHDIVVGVAAASGDGHPSGNGDVPAGDTSDAERGESAGSENRNDDSQNRNDQDDGPVHRPLIRASLPRQDGHQPPARPIPEFTIRQPGGRPNRFRPRHQHGGQQSQGNRPNGNMPSRGPRTGGGYQPTMKRHGPGGGGGRKRSR
jgi:hypothetical protein